MKDRDPDTGVGEENRFTLDLGVTKADLSGLWDGFARLLELAQRLEGPHGEARHEGTFGAGGDKDIRGVYGFSIRSGIDPEGKERAVVQPFGNLRKTASGTVVRDVREPLIDVFDEGDSVTIVAEMPGVAEDEIRYEVQDGVLLLRTVGERKYQKRIALSRPVNVARVQKRYCNGVLELSISCGKEPA
jgi:HSP20 family protein